MPCTPTRTRRPRARSRCAATPGWSAIARERAEVAAGWAFEVDDDYALFVFDIEIALLGARPSADDWPPRYSSWMDAAAAA